MTAMTYYEVLEITVDATSADIKKAYKKMAMKWHPDRNKGKDTNERFQLVRKAYTILMHKDSRVSYDNSIKQGKAKAPKAVFLTEAEFDALWKRASQMYMDDYADSNILRMLVQGGLSTEGAISWLKTIKTHANYVGDGQKSDKQKYKENKASGNSAGSYAETEEAETEEAETDAGKRSYSVERVIGYTIGAVIGIFAAIGIWLMARLIWPFVKLIITLFGGYLGIVMAGATVAFGIDLLMIIGGADVPLFTMTKTVFMFGFAGLVAIYVLILEFFASPIFQWLVDIVNYIAVRMPV